MRFRQYIAAVLFAAMLLALAAPPLDAATRQKTQTELRALRARIEAMAQQDSRDVLERDRLTAQLRAAELSLGHARGALDLTDREFADHAARRSALAAARAEQLRSLDVARVGLADELRAAYLVGREGPLKLLLNQESPLASGRLFNYYGYFGRAGADRIERIQSEVQRLNGLDAELAQQQLTLAGLKQGQQSQLQQLALGRDRRQQVLVSLTARTRTREQRLAQLQSQQADLERLLQELGRSRKPAPPPQDLASAFGRLRGRLAWPVSGHVTAAFGQQRASGLTWDGILIATPRDTPVHAVSAGRVVYADWLPGMGLLVIIDHGEGYLSLYGHNDRLFKAAGETVAADDVIAAAGDTGGRAEPQLYFEIRRAGKPVDPRPWFKTSGPVP